MKELPRPGISRPRPHRRAFYRDPAMRTFGALALLLAVSVSSSSLAEQQGSRTRNHDAQGSFGFQLRVTTTSSPTTANRGVLETLDRQSDHDAARHGQDRRGADASGWRSSDVPREPPQPGALPLFSRRLAIAEGLTGRPCPRPCESGEVDRLDRRRSSRDRNAGRPAIGHRSTRW